MVSLVNSYNKNNNPSLQRIESTERLEDYKKLCKIGEGTYGAVYKAVHQTTGEIVALKKFRLDEQGEGVPNTCLREISTLRRLNHPNIIRLVHLFGHGNYLAFCSLLQVFHTSRRFFLVVELMDYDLKALIASVHGEKFHPQLVKVSLIFKSCTLKCAIPFIPNIMWQLTQAIAFCHLNQIWHRDIKPQNLLIDRTGRVKLADFGLARFTKIQCEKYSSKVVTLWYRAPELLLGEKRYTSYVDIWSMGCVFFEMVTLNPLFPGTSEIDQLFSMFRLLGTPDDSVWPGISRLAVYSSQFPKWKAKRRLSLVSSAMPENGADLLLKMIAYCPETRIKAKSALSHVYFRDIDVANVAKFMPSSKDIEAP
ncbi:Cyclin-dependent kinase 2 [Trichuris trichiura]|uniref:cyclin-dependent kinase n=1 Tax=Trichuris trichiura TaxID=36087 RepID=A0A077ZEM7_TRITR|nr:Cyclin-dependent kinase 2 [Trichuris trichiura]